MGFSRPSTAANGAAPCSARIQFSGAVAVSRSGARPRHPAL